MRDIEPRDEPAVRFVGEQDGPPERELKEALRGILGRAPEVRGAYLARVAYGTSNEQHVVLCLAAPDSGELVRSVATEFSRRFGPSSHLDILFLDAAQEAECRRVCASFYQDRHD